MRAKQEEPDEQRVEAVPGRRTRKRRLRRRRAGCFSLLLLIVFLLLGGLIWRDHETLFRDGRFQFGLFFENLSSKGRDLSQTSGAEALDLLREKVAAIQKRGEKFVDSGEMRDIIDSLRADLEKKRDDGTEMATEHWDDLVARGERLVEKAKESEAWKKGQELPQEIRDFQTVLNQLKGLAPSQKGTSDGAKEDE